MKLKNSEIVSSFSGLNDLSGEDFVISLAWKIDTSIDTIKPFFTRFEETNGKLNEHFAMRDAEGKIIPTKNNEGVILQGTLTIPADKIEEWNTDAQVLLNLEVEVSDNVILHLSDFPVDYKIKPFTLGKLRSIILP